MRDLIKAALFTPTAKGWGLPLFFWGPPGVAKTDMIESVANEYGLYLKVLSPGESGEGAFGVTPVPMKGASSRYYMTYPEPDWLHEMEKTDGRAVVFIDEATHAPRSVQPAILALIQARRIGGAPLGSLCRVLAAGNPPGEGSGGYELTDATANRLCHIDWQPPTLDAWSNWLWSVGTLDNGGVGESSAADEEARVLRAWPKAINDAKMLVTGFLRFKSSLFYSRPDSASPQLYRAWPSMRTWYLATLAIASARVHYLDPEVADTLIEGFVGPAACTSLREYEASRSLPDIEGILDGKRSFDHDPARLDITYTVLASCASVVANPNTPNREKRASRLWDLTMSLIEDGAEDIAVMTAKTLVRATPLQNGERLTQSKSAQRVLEKIKPSLEAAGYGR